MGDNWTEATLEDVAEVIMGRQLSPSKRLGLRPRRYLRAANVGGWGIDLSDLLEMDFTADEEAKFRVEIGDILLVEGGNEKSVGCPALITESERGLCIQNTLIRCRVQRPDLVTPRFLFHMLRHEFWRGKFGELCAGTTIMHLGQKRAAALTLKFPPPRVQARIVDMVESVDAYIAGLEKQVEAVRTARNSVLHELLTTGTEHWSRVAVGDIAEVVGGGTPSTKNPEFWGGNVIWLTPTEVVARDGQVIHDSERKISELGLRSSGAKLLPEGTVVLTSRASVGFVAIAGCPMSTNQGFQSLVPGPSVLSRFLLFWVQMNRQEFESRSAGSTFKEISNRNVRSIPLNLPPLNEQERIVEVVSSMDDVVVDSERLLAEGRSLRAGLLAGLLSGNHQIPESYDKFLGAA